VRHAIYHVRSVDHGDESVAGFKERPLLWCHGGLLVTLARLARAGASKGGVWLHSQERSSMKKSAGILMYKRTQSDILVLLVHPGGPFWRKRDEGAWSIPKGEYPEDEPAETAARREFAEEIGHVPEGSLQPLGELRQKGGKHVTAFALEGEFDTSALRSNPFEIEWPPRSGRLQSFPEVDRAEWFTLSDAREKIMAGQLPFLERLETLDRPTVASTDTTRTEGPR
jgi:predicted NUDIX family NTP pyrophosphohydrolase